MSTFTREMIGGPAAGMVLETKRAPFDDGSVPFIVGVAPGQRPDEAGVYLLTGWQGSRTFWSHHPAGLRDGRPA